MLDCALNTALLLQTFFQPLVSLKYFVSFKVIFKSLDLEKKAYFKNLFRKMKEMVILLF